MTSRRQSSVASRYGLAVLAVVAAGLLRWILKPWLADDSPFLFFILPVLAAAWCGAGPGVLASILSLALGIVFAGPHALTLAGVISIATFALSAGGIVFLVANMGRSRARASASDDHAEHLEDATRAALQELNLLVDGAEGVALYLLDNEGNVAIWNRGAERLKGWSEDEVIGRHTSLFYPADAVSRGKPEADLDSATREGRLVEEDWRMRKDGSEFLASVSITALYDEAGLPRGFAKIVRDITDQRASENALRASGEHFQSILSTVPDAMVVIDDHGLITSFSAAAEKLFGYEQREVVGTNISRLMPSPDREQHDAYIERYLRTGERRIIGKGRTVTGQRVDGTTFPMELFVGEARAGEQRVFTGFVRDLTQRRATEEQMQSLQAELIHVSRVSAMGTMASTLAHELNQPITAVANYVEGVRDLLAAPEESDVPMIRDALNDAAKEAMRAGDIVRKLRDFVSRGELERTIEPLHDLIREAAVLGLMGARERGVETHFEVKGSGPLVLVDKVQIQQVLINLIRNAVEAMAQSTAKTLTIRSAAEPKGMVRVSVIDSGPGISSDLADALFSAFVTTKTDGMGLGLSICRTIVEAHGGKIWMEPGPQSGTSFHFTLVAAGEEGENGR